jgi:peptide/nickel transport system permease protein
MGVSFSRYPQEVSTILWQALPRTLVLFLSATILAFWLGFKTGKLIAWRRGALTEQGLITSGIFLQTVFYPWFAIVMLWLFGFYFGWFPIGRFIDARLWQGSPYDANNLFFQMILSVIAVSVIYGIGRWLIARFSRNLVTQSRLSQALGLASIAGLFVFWWVNPATEYVADIAHHTMLPVITLGLVAFGATMLLTRSAMLETLGEDYILTARAKGIPDNLIRDRHAARNAMLPVTTSLVLALAFVIGGGIVTETIFSWPGMGLIFLQAINVSDIPLAVGALSITGVLALFGHLVADILYAVLDPRIRVA